MKSALYGKYFVNVFHNGQYRRVILHVVHCEGNTEVFLFDIYGYAIDCQRAVGEAKERYAAGDIQIFE